MLIMHNQNSDFLCLFIPLDSYKVFLLSKKLSTLLQKQPPEVFFKKRCFLKISENSQQNTCVRVYFLLRLQTCDLLVQVFSCEFCETCKTNFFTEHLWTAASACWEKRTRSKKFSSYLAIHKEMLGRTHVIQGVFN